MYYATVFFLRLMFTSTPPNSTPPIAPPREGYSQLLLGHLHGCFTLIRMTTMLWNHPRFQTKRMLTTQISNPRMRMACTTALIKVVNMLDLTRTAYTIILIPISIFRKPDKKKLFHLSMMQLILYLNIIKL